MSELVHDAFKTFGSLKEYWKDDKQMIGDKLTKEDVAYDVRSLLEYCDRLRAENERLKALLKSVWVQVNEGDVTDFGVVELWVDQQLRNAIWNEVKDSEEE